MFGIQKELYSSSVVNLKTKIKGDIVVDGEIIIRGFVEGSVTATSVVVEKIGAVKGKITANNVLVGGNVEGNIKTISISLLKTAVVKGDIHHKKISMENGALVDGSLKKAS